MFKVMVLIKKKNGMSMEAFIDHYEKVHAPLAEGLIPGLKKYVRHFLWPYGDNTYEAAQEQPFHVATELWFADEAAFKCAMAALAEPETAKTIQADEEYLFERSSISFMRVEMHESQI